MTSPAEPLPQEVVAATADHIRRVISALDALELGETAPAPTYSPVGAERKGATDAAV